MLLFQVKGDVDASLAAAGTDSGGGNLPAEGGPAGGGDRAPKEAAQ